MPPKTKKSNKSLSSKQKRAVNTIVKKQLNANIETKYHKFSGTAIIINNGGYIRRDLFEPPQGLTDVSRIGDRVRLMSYVLYGKFRFTPGAAGTQDDATVRLVLFQWTEQDAATEPANNQILLDSVYNSILNSDTRDSGALHVLHDRTYDLSAYGGHGNNLSIKLSGSKKLKRNVQYSGAGVYGTNKIMLLMYSDKSGSSTNVPTFDFRGAINYTDA